MPSFIYSQRRNVDRLLAFILLWNVVAGAFVTLGAPWLAEIAGTTSLRPATVPPTGSGWLAIGVPTHFAGIWLAVLGGYALYRMRRHLRWYPAAVLFYAPQTFAITSPLHADMWIGLFAATSFQLPVGPAIAVNWIAITLLLIHACLELLDSKFQPYLTRTPAVVRSLFRDFWGAMLLWRTALSRAAPLRTLPLPTLPLRTPRSRTPLSRTALSLRYASIATITAFFFLLIVPREIFYPSGQRPEMPWRLLLVLPMTAVAAYVMAFAWSGSQREPRFSDKRGAVAAMLAFVYLSMALDLLSRWLGDGQDPIFQLFVIGWFALLPYTALIPAIGAITGAWLGRNVAAPQESPQGRSSRLTWGMSLTLATPLLALLLSYALGAPERDRIEIARVVAQRALAHFDQNEPEQLYAMFATDSLAKIDRDSFIATLRERRDSIGELRSRRARRELQHSWYPRSGLMQFDYRRAGVRGRSRESIVIDVRGPTLTVSTVLMTFEPQPAENTVLVLGRNCLVNDEKLYCGGIGERPPRSLF